MFQTTAILATVADVLTRIMPHSTVFAIPAATTINCSKFRVSFNGIPLFFLKLQKIVICRDFSAL